MSELLPIEGGSNKHLARALFELRPFVLTDAGIYSWNDKGYWAAIPRQDFRAFVLGTFGDLVPTYQVEREVKATKKEPAHTVVEDKFVDLSKVSVFSDLEVYCRHAPDYYKGEFFQDVAVGFACRNGFVDCSTQRHELVPAHPGQRCRIFLDFNYDEQATCPFTQEVIDSFFVEDKDNDGPGKKQALLEFYAMCLLGQINQDKRGRILWITGEPGTGKSTLIDSLNKALIPPEFMASVDPKSFGDPEQILDLVGKLLNFVDEVDEKTITNATIVRKVVAGAEMKPRQLYKGFFNARFRAGHLIVANIMPRQADESGALIDRTTHIHFTHRFKRPNETADSVERRIIGERAGIVNLLLRYYADIMQRPSNERNVITPKSALTRRAEMLEDGNIFRQFVKILQPAIDKRYRAADLLRVFQHYKAVHGHLGPNLSSGVLARKVMELKPELKIGEAGGAAIYSFIVVDDSEQVVYDKN